MARGYWRVQRYQVFYGDGSSVYASTEKQAVKLAKKYKGLAVECDGGRQIYAAAEHTLAGGRLQLVRVYDESEVEEVAVGEYQVKSAAAKA